MVKSRKKYTLIGGAEATSQQLSEWGSTGGRPRKWKNEAERKRFARQQKKALRNYRSYGEVKIKKHLTCPNCGKIDNNLRQYFNEKGEYIPETCWFDTVRMERRRVPENQYHCLNCYQIFSFHSGELKVQETKTIIPQAGTNTQRSQRSRAKKQKSTYG
jgi:hypothetical protein